uniref:C2H2-type domain-containing protein n=1 Tax=Steinernema glaseri TaxID=37863 RepID=A0A1I8AT86_9BILA
MVFPNLPSRWNGAHCQTCAARFSLCENGSLLHCRYLPCHDGRHVGHHHLLLRHAHTSDLLLPRKRRLPGAEGQAPEEESRGCLKRTARAKPTYPDESPDLYN